MRIIQNRRARKLCKRFISALLAKESRCERDEAFQAEHAPAYEAFGKRVEQADKAARSAAWRKKAATMPWMWNFCRRPDERYERD